MAVARKSLEERIADEQKRRDAADRKLRDLKARQAGFERKADTRRKIVLGAMLIDQAQSGSTDAAIMVENLISLLTKENDKAMFEGWSWETGSKKE